MAPMLCRSSSVTPGLSVHLPAKPSSTFWICKTPRSSLVGVETESFLGDFCAPLALSLRGAFVLPPWTPRSGTASPPKAESPTELRFWVTASRSSALSSPSQHGSRRNCWRVMLILRLPPLRLLRF